MSATGDAESGRTSADMPLGGISATYYAFVERARRK